jgi:hypothetical protein
MRHIIVFGRDLNYQISPKNVSIQIIQIVEYHYNIQVLSFGRNIIV